MKGKELMDKFNTSQLTLRMSRRVYTSANDAVCRVLPNFAAAITAWQ